MYNVWNRSKLFKFLVAMSLNIQTQIFVEIHLKSFTLPGITSADHKFSRRNTSMHASILHFLPLSSSWHKLVCTWFVKSTVHTNPVLINPYFHYLLWAENLHSKGINFRWHFSGHNWPRIMWTIYSVFQVGAFNMHITTEWVLDEMCTLLKESTWEGRKTLPAPIINSSDMYSAQRKWTTWTFIPYTNSWKRNAEYCTAGPQCHREYISQPLMSDFQFHQCLMYMIFPVKFICHFRPLHIWQKLHNGNLLSPN
jgi:hypothetical protein